MTGTPLVVLDACVLANFSLCDTLLRLAEPPRLFEPKWSEEIIRETTRTLESKLGWPGSLTAHLETELRAHFGEAWISGYEPLIPRMANDKKDRHVLAAAAHGQASIIVTLNLRHFRRGVDMSVDAATHECVRHIWFSNLKSARKTNAGEGASTGLSVALRR